MGEVKGRGAARISPSYSGKASLAWILGSSSRATESWGSRKEALVLTNPNFPPSSHAQLDF